MIVDLQTQKYLITEDDDEEEDQDDDGDVGCEGGGEELNKAVGLKLPEIPAGAKWASDAGAAQQVLKEAKAAKGSMSEGLSDVWGKYGFDAKISGVFRDWTQVMSLVFSKLLPQAPVFTVGIAFFFALAALDLAAFSAPFNIDIAATWTMAVFVASGLLFLAFQYFWWTQKSNPDAITDGAETNHYADQSALAVMLKLGIINACHFFYLQVANNVFQETYNYYYREQAADDVLFYLSIVLLIGFLLCVPLVTLRLIYQNKPRGSTEDAGQLPP